MFMNRDRMSLWVRLVAFGLAAVFVGTFVFFGIGSLVSYNLLDLISGGGNEQDPAAQTAGLEEQVQRAEQELEGNPEDPDAIVSVGSLYLQDDRTEEAVEVLERGREVAPQDEDVALLLGQARAQQAQSAPEEERADLYRQSGEAFAAATEIEPENEDAFLAAGDAYEQAGESGLAIQYYNGYLDLEPDSEQAPEVEQRISDLLAGGGETTGG